MAVHLCPARPCAFLDMLLLTLLPMLSSVLITEEEAALLAKAAQDIICFSRTFEDLTCFWDEPAHVERQQRFFYTYKGDRSRECSPILVKHSASGQRHVCIFPSDHHGIQLFRELCVEVLDTASNRTTHSQKLSVDAVGLIAPPTNVTAVWSGLARELQVTWVPPPISYIEFLAYEVLYRAEGTGERPSRMEVKCSPACQLRDLLPGQRYHIQVRTKPDGLSFDGLWGPWSQVVLAETPHLPGEIGLHCFTPDLHQLHCQWDWSPTEPDASQSHLYWAEDNSNKKRTQVWQKCEEEEKVKLLAYPYSHVCTFQPSNSSYISVLVTVTQDQQEVNYLEEPFELHHVVLTAPPRILQSTVNRGTIKLEWASPLEKLAEHLVYQIQYAPQDTLKLKTLQVQYSNNTEIHLANVGCYCFQLRTQPDGQMFRGRWSAWSEAVCIEIPPGADSIILNVAVPLLLCVGLVLGLGCTCLSIYSVKQKLWPPIPDLHRVLDGFLEDNGKQQQQMNAFFCNKTLEDVPLTCLLEVLSGVPLETPNYGPLQDTISMQQAEWNSQPSSHQHYMVLNPCRPQGGHNEIEYFDGTDDGYDSLPLSLEHDPSILSDPKTELSSFALFGTPLSAHETKEERKWEASGDQSTSATHISNQSYLLMG
ncbi:thrombopoietin receptor isoform X2 [Varanus komodoensis]|uniref:thrombopoietin receptor isoform X2 n=1 Tax=Varanus komodoensis TaxID=61221 RepID=UPI001CF7B185|nr:thrombopoietin receptor isoform X2 [Varanus komodoensis]